MDRGLAPGDRVMSSLGWSLPEEIVDNLLAVFVDGASLVQVGTLDQSLFGRRRETEQATRDLR